MCGMVGSDPPRRWPRKGIWIDDKGNLVSNYNKDKYSNISFVEGKQFDPYHDVQQQMFDAFDIGNRQHKECSGIINKAVVEDALE